MFVNESELVTWGEAALHVCSRGTSDQSFLRRDDCDGCLCPLGSLWMHYKDARFFGDGEYCVPEKQWKDCISRWACCKHKPNYCWDFIFDGARRVLPLRRDLLRGERVSHRDHFSVFD